MSRTGKIFLRERRSLRYALVIGLYSCAALLAGMVIGCDTPFSPFPDEHADPAHVFFGVLDASADTQFVRVQIVRQELELPPVKLNDFAVTSSATDTGLLTWSDSLVFLDDGSQAHLFYSVYKPGPGLPITLRAFGPEGRETTVTVTMPIRPIVQTKQTMFFNGGIIKSILLEGISQKPDEIGLSYSVFDAGLNEFRSIDIPYSFSVGVSQPSGWEFTVNLSGDRSFVAAGLHVNINTPVLLGSVEVLMTEFGPEWENRSPNDVGFVGAIGRFSIPFAFDSATSDSLNYTR